MGIKNRRLRQSAKGNKNYESAQKENPVLQLLSSHTKHTHTTKQSNSLWET